MKDMKMKSSPLSTVSHLATNATREQWQTKGNLRIEEERKYSQFDIRQTSVEKTS